MAKKNFVADTSTTDYIAMMFYATDCHKNNQTAVRWLCLREDILFKYLTKAKDEYVRWVADEKQAEIKRREL